MKTIGNTSFAVVLRGIALAALCLCLATMLEGCSVKRMLHIGPPLSKLKSLSVGADPGANQGNATEVDVVIAYSNAAVGMLPKTGPEWFQQRDALRKALATDVDVISLEVPSPSAPIRVKLPRRSRNKGLAVVAFANYAAPGGWPVVKISPYKRARLQLQDVTVTISEQ